MRTHNAESTKYAKKDYYLWVYFIDFLAYLGRTCRWDIWDTLCGFLDKEKNKHKLIPNGINLFILK
ncbi:MAG: hypothetical protein OHK0057_03810 [Thermoflexibacter sp.]